MKKFIYGFVLLSFVFAFNACEEEAEECKTCTLTFTWAAGTDDLQAEWNADAVDAGFADLHAEFEADYAEEGVSFGEVCGDAIQTSEANYAEYTEGIVAWDLDGDGETDMTEAYTCQ